VGALKGYETVHEPSLSLWEETYPNALLLALTDTFSTQAFFKVCAMTQNRYSELIH
ncbi:hypothetical protein MPER_15312, partial [Moniliophthora perniciosa FA553]